MPKALQFAVESKEGCKSNRRCLIKVAALLFIGASTAIASAHVSAEYLKGMVFYLKQEYKSAYDELLPVAEAGHAIAQFIVGTMYREGQFVTQDGKAASEWFRKASEQGHPNAQFDLAVLLSKGADVPLDREAAYQWAALAAERLHGPKQGIAVALSDAIAGRLGKTELERAKAAAAAWRPRLAIGGGESEGPQRPPSTGNGFFLSATGMILTNQHLAYPCQKVEVSYGGEQVDGILLDVDFEADLATVQTDLKPPIFARFASEGRPQVGARVTVVGHAVERTKSVRTLTSSGTVLYTKFALLNFASYQTSVPIYRGQSGSPAFDERGQVVGAVRGVSPGQPADLSHQTADGQAAVVGVDSISRFLSRTKAPFERASVNDSAPTVGMIPDFVVQVRCFKSPAFPQDQQVQ